MAERRFGILIANSEFPEEPKLEDLRYPENDVQDLKEILVSEDRGGFFDIKTFVNDPHHIILREINQTLKSADKNDLILIYYSGHGKLNSVSHLHLATTDTDVNALESTSISIGRIKEFVDVSSTKKVILILDCCYSGAVGAEFVKVRGCVDEQLQFASAGRGTYIMTASTAVQVAIEKEADQHGVFTKHLIEGIRSGNADLDEDGLISMADLYRYVHDHVLDECHQEPMKWDLGVRGELFIARSGKKPREERYKQLRSTLFDLAKEGLPDDVLTKALKIISLKPEQVTDRLKDYDNLLEKLYHKSIQPFGFIHEWNQINDRSPPVAIKPASKPIPTNGVDLAPEHKLTHTEGEHDQDIIGLDKATKLNPDDADAYNSRGITWNKKGKYDRAITDLNKAIELNPDYADAYYNRGGAWNKKGKYDRAITDLNKAIELNPDHVAAYNSRGFAWNKKGKYDRAIADLDKAIKLNPDLAYAFNNRGVAWKEKCEYDWAIIDSIKKNQ